MAGNELYSTSLLNDANLEAYYRFESGALTTDSSSKGRTLTQVGTINVGTGKFGGDASATWGVDNRLEDTTGALSVGTGAFTIGCWMKKNGAPSNNFTPTLICLTTTGGLRVNIVVTKTNGYAYFQTYDGASTDVATTTAVCDNNWHFLVATRDGTSHKIYVDDVATSGTGTARNCATTMLRLGMEYDATYDALGAAEIDDAFVFSRALTSAEISSLYLTSASKFALLGVG
jgi:hypothetical protein